MILANKKCLHVTIRINQSIIDFFLCVYMLNLYVKTTNTTEDQKKRYKMNIKAYLN